MAVTDAYFRQGWQTTASQDLIPSPSAIPENIFSSLVEWTMIAIGRWIWSQKYTEPKMDVSGWKCITATKCTQPFLRVNKREEDKEFDWNLTTLSNVVWTQSLCMCRLYQVHEEEFNKRWLRPFCKLVFETRCCATFPFYIRLGCKHFVSIVV